MSGEWGTVLWTRAQMHRPSIWPSLILYIGATSTFLFLLFLFFDTQGLSWSNFWIAMVIFIPAIGAVGYLLLSDLLESKQRQDKRLEHMAKEVLHEINLPISTIETNIQMLQPRLTDQKDIKRMERITSSTQRLKRLYDTLMYNIKREISTIEPEEFDLANLVQERVAVYEEMGRNHFETSLTPLSVRLDRIGFEQVIDNIFENSMKYSNPDKPIRVEMADGKIVISDMGIGMDRGEIARIYERYYQGDSHNPGEGIGLALVKRYCDEAGIGIKIASEPKNGTKVILDMAQVTQK